MVARAVGEGVDVDDAEAVALGLELVVGAIVRVTFRTVGKTLTRARVWEPELVMEVVVKDVVSGITVMLAEIVEELDWADAESMKEA